MWRLVAPLLALSVLGGCDEIGDRFFPLDDPESSNYGTVAGVDACTQKTESKVLSAAAAKLACAAKHQRRAKSHEIRNIDGRLRFNNDTGGGTVSGDLVTLTVTNNSSDFIVTRVWVTVGEVDGEHDRYSTMAGASSGPLWVEPGASAGVNLSLSREIEFRKKGQHSFQWFFYDDAMYVVPFEAGNPS